ncbi:MAG: HAD family hydrolase [Planctomycetes bacterium]|nr:HAD family hydrolase [Planctomycetota bacterium]
MNRPLVIIDLDGTTGLYHFAPRIGKVFLRPDLAAGLAELATDCCLALATRAEESYARAVEAILAQRGVRFDGVFSRSQVALVSPSPWAEYFKHFRVIQENFGVADPERVIVVGDLMNLAGNPFFLPRDYRRRRFEEEPDLLCSGMSLTDHPVERRIVYLVVPQVLTPDADGAPRSLSMRAVARTIHTLLDRGSGSFLAGYRVKKILDPPDERVECDLLSQRMGLEIAAGRSVHDPQGRCLDEEFKGGEPHRYIVLKGRRGDWKPLEEVEAELRIE